MISYCTTQFLFPHLDSETQILFPLIYLFHAIDSPAHANHTIPSRYPTDGNPRFKSRPLTHLSARNSPDVE
jgi:hypothetical protein